MTFVPGSPAAETTFAMAKRARKGAKRKMPAPAESKLCPSKWFKVTASERSGTLAPLDGATELQPGATRKLRKTLLSEHTLDGAHRYLHAIVQQDLRDLACRQALTSPFTDRPSGLGADATARCPSFGHGLGEVDLAVAELVAQQSEIARAVAEAVSDHRGRQPLDERGSQSLITDVASRVGG